VRRPVGGPGPARGQNTQPAPRRRTAFFAQAKYDVPDIAQAPRQPEKRGIAATVKRENLNLENNLVISDGYLFQ
jgi:hypothetical protein